MSLKLLKYASGLAWTSNTSGLTFSHILQIYDNQILRQSRENILKLMFLYYFYKTQPQGFNYANQRQFALLLYSLVFLYCASLSLEDFPYVVLLLRYFEMITSSGVFGMFLRLLSSATSQNLREDTRKAIRCAIFININCCQFMQQPRLKPNHINNALIIVYGPPASGKSTVAHQMKRYFEESETCQVQRSIVISCDCLEEYLRSHSIKDLRVVFQSQAAINELMNLKLRRMEFIEQNWKLSRALIKEIIPQLIKQYSLVIIEDDMLLKSQRKYFRHIAQAYSLPYLEIFLECTLEQCFENSRKRLLSEGSSFQLSEQKIRQCFSKFQHEINPYTIVHHFREKISWKKIAQELKQVKIYHPQQIQKPIPNEESSAKDSSEVQIRKFISEIMTNKQLQYKYFKTNDLKQISSLIQAIKKTYKSKSKSFLQFLTHFQNQTNSIN